MAFEPRSHCPVNFALETIGDQWSLLILRDMIFRGKRTYNQFLSSEEGFATNILAARLLELERTGILTKRPDPSDGRKSVFELTQKGLDLIPMIFEMMLWSAKYDPKSEARRIKGLIEKIRADNRKVSAKIIQAVRQGHALLPDHLDKTPKETHR